MENDLNMNKLCLNFVTITVNESSFTRLIVVARLVTLSDHSILKSILLPKYLFLVKSPNHVLYSLHWLPFVHVKKSKPSKVFNCTELLEKTSLNT